MRRTPPNLMGNLPFYPNPNPNFTNNFSRKQLNLQNGDNDFPLPSTTSDDADASSFNHNHNRNNHSSLSRHVIYDISGYSKSEIRSLKSRLISELDKVRNLSIRIDSGDFRNPNPKKRNLPISSSQQQQQSQGVVKRGKQQSNQNQNQELLSSYVASPQVMKMCAQVLSKVMKQKSGYVFNDPVDVVGMGLHDYHQIVKKPMDLGTIKRNLGCKVYSTPEDFANDVRLTFNNALLYNPKGHEVHMLAERFLAKFELYFQPVYHKFMSEKHKFLRHPKLVEPRPSKDDVVATAPAPAPAASVVVLDEVQGSSWSKNPSPEPPKIVNPPKKPEPRPEPRVELPPPPVPVSVPEPDLGNVAAAQEVVRTGSMGGGGGRGSSGKQPKPRAKDPNKREMSIEEKHKLGTGLQSLPEEKMTQVIQIIRKRNGHLTQDGDEIELDIEAVDKETLWELDRFVTNYKKAVSKLRRQALMDMQNNNVGHHGDVNQLGGNERVMETAKAVKRGGGDDEDVDIGDEMPVHNFPPVEIDKDDDRSQGGGVSSNSTSSSSSGSDSSSSSDSDSGSSSGSDSDVDDAQSRDNESKNIPR